MKIQELLDEGIRYGKPIPNKKWKVKEVPPNTRGAWAEKVWEPNLRDYIPTGRWLKNFREIERDEHGNPKLSKPYYDAEFHVASDDFGNPTRAGKAGEGFVRGPVGDWLDLMGATKADIPAALEIVRRSPEYQRLMALGFEEKPTPISEKDGTLVLVGTLEPSLANPDTMHLYYHVLPNGKIRVLPRQPSRYGGPVQTFQPLTAETHPNLSPVERVAGSMIQSLSKLRKVVVKHVKSHLFKQK